MKNKVTFMLLALGVALPVANLQAQDATTERPQREGRGPRGDRPMPGIIGALDSNSDRKIDKSELAAATEALKKLDKDSDGKLTMAELRGNMGRGPREGQGANANSPSGEERGPRASGEERAGQRREGGGDRPFGGPGSVVAAIDVNSDAVLDAEELKGAAAAIAKLDKNSDGELTMDELQVARGRGQGGRGPRDGGKAGGEESK